MKRELCPALGTCQGLERSCTKETPSAVCSMVIRYGA